MLYWPYKRLELKQGTETYREKEASIMRGICLNRLYKMSHVFTVVFGSVPPQTSGRSLINIGMADCVVQ